MDKEIERRRDAQRSRDERRTADRRRIGHTMHQCRPAAHVAGDGFLPSMMNGNALSSGETAPWRVGVGTCRLQQQGPVGAQYVTAAHGVYVDRSVRRVRGRHGAWWPGRFVERESRGRETGTSDVCAGTHTHSSALAL